MNPHWNTHRDSSVTALTEDAELVCREPAHEPGKLDGYGICMDCGENYSACVGLYYCPFCSGEM